jgi:uncharacterized tellurite resistance protein B-like protein
MLAQLKKIFGSEPKVTGLLEKRDPVELATAALLIEMARSDFSESPEERLAVRHLLERRFKLSEPELDLLIADAERRVNDAVSLHEFTHRLNRELSEPDKLAIIEMLWRVSHADGHVDKHEEHLVARIAGLLHISDRDRIRMKVKVVVDR